MSTRSGGAVGRPDPDEECRVSDERPQHESPLVAPGATSGAASEVAGASSATPWADQSGPGLPPPPAYASSTGRPLHKPGTVPLRPLTLSDFFDGAFTTVRRNPLSTIGMGALVTGGFMLLPILASLALGLAGGLNGAMLSADTARTTPGASTFVLYAVSGISSIFGLLANVVVAGLVVPVVTRAAIGEKVSTSAAWRQVRGRLPALIGLAVLELVLILAVVGGLTGLGAGLGYATSGLLLAIGLGILLFVVGVVAAIGIHVKWFQLAAPSLVVERRGVFASIARAGRLSGGSFWRILGILLLTSLLTGIVGQIIGVPFTLAGAVLGGVLDDPAGPISLLIASNLAAVVSGAIIAPFTGTVAVLQYLDQRFRREGFDIDLITHVQRRPTP